MNCGGTLTGKRALIVGGAGFVGTNLSQLLLNQDIQELVIVDNLLSAERFNIPESGKIRFIEGSITDPMVLNQIDDSFEYIFHLATFHGNQNSIIDPLADHENNTLTTLKLFEHIKSFAKIQKVVYSSAGCTVAEKTFDKAFATDEDAPVSLYLDSPYQMSKIFGEFYANYYWQHRGLPIVKARFQNVYGPGEILGAGRWRGTYATVWRNVTPTFIYRALRGLPLMLENEGIATRDFIYAGDVAEGLLRCALAGQAGEVYNLASGAETSIMDIAQTIIKLTGHQSDIEYLPKRAWDNSGKRFGSTQKAKEALGFVARMPLEQGLKITIKWTMANIKKIEAVMKKHDEYMR